MKTGCLVLLLAVLLSCNRQKETESKFQIMKDTISGIYLTEPNPYGGDQLILFPNNTYAFKRWTDFGDPLSDSGMYRISHDTLNFNSRTKTNTRVNKNFPPLPLIEGRDYLIIKREIYFQQTDSNGPKVWLYKKSK